MSENKEVKTVVAEDIRALKKALQDAKPEGGWSVEKGQFGHASVICYNVRGNRSLIIRNKP